MMIVDLSKCELVPSRCGVSEFDFIVRCQRPDGTLVAALIPDVLPAHYTRIGDADENQEPYGLNLVCSGHYT
jgi:hypothetical protein